MLAETLLTGLFTSAPAIGAGVVGLRPAGMMFGRSGGRFDFLLRRGAGNIEPYGTGTRTASMSPSRG